MRDLCDVGWALMVEEAQREAQTLALAAVFGGGEYVDPVAELREWVAAEPAAHDGPDAELRRALGLT